MSLQLFDCHFHIETGIEKYNISVDGKNIIFNSIESYEKHKHLAGATDSISLILEYRDHLSYVADLLSEKKLNALKIHSRIQRIAEKDYPQLCNAIESLMPLKVPVIIDAFYFGSDMDFQPNLKEIAAICRRFKETKFIIAHSGGYEVLKYFYHLKELPNVYYDLSLSLSYLKNTSVFIDFKNLIRWSDPERMLFGTDYPFIDAKNQLEAFLEIAKDVGLSDASVNEILYTNSGSVFWG